MKKLKYSVLLAFMILLIMLLSTCGQQTTLVATEVPTTAPITHPTAVPTQAVIEVPPTEAPTEIPTVEPCAPATDGPLSGIDPRGQNVVWWHQQSGSKGDALTALIIEFNSSNDAQYQGSYYEIRDKMNASIATGELPALVVGYQNDEAFYALAGGLADITPYMTDSYWGLTTEEVADFNPVFLKQGIHAAFGNLRLGFPPNRSAEVIFYNLTWLKELGFSSPPTSPEEFKAMSCAAAKANGDGTGGFILRADVSGIAAWTYAFGGDILSTDGLRYEFNSQATKDSMAFLKGMVDEGCAYFLTEGYPDPAFASRKAIFTQGSTSGLPYYQEGTMNAATENNRPADEWGVTALPHTTTEPWTNIYGGDVMIPATNPETQLAAWVFIKWFTTPEIMAKWDEASGYFPTRTSASEFLKDYIAQNAQYGEGLALLQYSKYEPQLISYQGVRDLASKVFHEIMQGADTTITLDSLTEQANALQAELQLAP
jgi:multiple sugar transport system substrate-binding protein/sn-glycerol 3-phosphate transport system substrate-binding protein